MLLYVEQCIHTHECIIHSLAAIYHTNTGRVTGPEINVSLKHKFIVVTLLCWRPTFTILGDRTPLRVPIAMEQKKQCSTWYCSGQHMSRFIRRHGPTSTTLHAMHCNVNVIRPKMPLEIPGADQSSNLSPTPWLRMGEQDKPTCPWSINEIYFIFHIFGFKCYPWCWMC